MNDLIRIDQLKEITAELYRSYILAGRKKDAPEISDLSEQAGAIIEMNSREPHPVPPAVWRDLFQFARRKWSLCGFGELMRAWEGEEFSLWQAERRRTNQKQAADPVHEAPVRQEDFAETWLQIWEEAFSAGNWVPNSIIAQIKEKQANSKK